MKSTDIQASEISRTKMLLIFVLYYIKLQTTQFTPVYQVAFVSHMLYQSIYL